MARARRVRTASKESSDARQSPDVEAAKNGSVASEETRARAAAEGEMNKLQPQATRTTLTGWRRRTLDSVRATLHCWKPSH